MSSRDKRDRKKYGRISSMYVSPTQIPIDPFNYTCPYCGKKMQYMTADEFYGHAVRSIDKFIVCKDCDVRGRVKKCADDIYFLISTPANRKTRLLRTEAHYYFNKLYENGIFSGQPTAYAWLTRCFGRQMFVKEVQCHIGEMNEQDLKTTIRITVKKLANYPDRFDEELQPFDKFESNYSDESNEVMETIRMLNQKIAVRKQRDAEAVS